jgi:5-methylcytosine-specific restriction protein A
MNKLVKSILEDFDSILAGLASPRRETRKFERPSIDSVKDFMPGNNYSRRSIIDAFKVSSQGGVNFSSVENIVVVISDSSQEPYFDRWENGVFKYAGTGQVGNQTLTRGNKTLLEAESKGRTIVLFLATEAAKVAKNYTDEYTGEKIPQSNSGSRNDRYFYVGEVTLIGEPGEEIQEDLDRNPRKVYTFDLKPVNSDVERILGRSMKNYRSMYAA